MTITRADLAIFQPVELGSAPTAGGPRTKKKVLSGAINQLLRAISDIDHAGSAVDIAKFFPALNTSGTEVLLDGHIFISAPPTDPLVSLLIAESPSLTDASRMTDMVDILESSVRAGQLIRHGLIGLLAGQDSFPRAYLQSMYSFNDKDYWANVTLQQGQVICISVEYAGNEDARYPRFEHFCEIQRTVTGGQEGQVFFKPPIPFDTPDRNVTINGESQCTKLRYTSENSDIKYHGVTKLVAVSGNLLTVESTRAELLPKVKTVAVSAGNTITSNDSGDVASGLIYKTTMVPGESGKSTYIYSVPDLLTDPYFERNGIKNVIAVGYAAWAASLSITGSSITAVYSYSDSLTGKSVGLSWYSSLRYSIYSSAAALPAAKKLVKGSVFAVATFADSNYGSSTLSEFNNGELREINGQVLATIDYLTGTVTKMVDNRGDFTVSYEAMIEDEAISDNTAIFTLTQPNPILDSFYVTVSSTDQTLLSGSADSNGVVSGSGISGTISAGEVNLSFASAVDLTTLRYDIAETVTLSPPPELYGLNPLRLKNGGLVPMFNEWGKVVVQNTQTQLIVSPAPGQTFNVRPDARFVDITDANGASLWTVADSHFTHDKTSGVVTLNSDFAGFTGPFLLTNTIGELAMAVAVGETSLTLAAPLAGTYPATGTVVASVQNLGDLQARVSQVRDMESWDNNWDLDGAAATANLNVVDFPIEVKNNEAVNEEWVLIFTSPTAFRCVGKQLGQITTGDTLSDFAPINPLTGQPYFIIRQQAFGGGWNMGEAIRFATIAASKPGMLIRSVASGHSQITTDRATLGFRGNES